jgi:CRP-like cAMP-binding protein
VAQGAAADDLFILISGAAAVSRNGVAIATLATGDTFGGMALADRAKRLVEVVLTEDSRVIAIAIDDLDRLMASRPRLGYSVMRQLVASLGEKIGSARVEGGIERLLYRP